jgi:uroporphyrin-III C-methyltransferase
VIILMAMSKLEVIMDIFCKYGKRHTPVAIIQDGTTGKEKMITGVVEDIYFRSVYENLSNPAVIVVGEVVKLHPSLITEVMLQQPISKQQLNKRN